MTAIDGIVSGIDTSGLIDSIIGAAAGPKRTMEATRADLQARRERLATLTGQLSDVSAAIGEVDKSAGWLRPAITSGDAAGFSASTTPTAPPGSYDVRVDSLARAQVNGSQGFADADSLGVIAEGTLKITLGDTTHDIVIDGSNSSLKELADDLGALEGITAYTVNTGDATNPYRLVLQADGSGSGGAFSVDTSGLGGAGTVPTFATLTAASDASVQVNGMTITSSTNRIEGAIPGITLDLKAEGGPAEMLTIGQDDDALLDKLEAVFESYNKARGFYNTNSFFNSETGNRGPLATDATSRRAFDRLGSLVSRSYEGAGADVVALSQLGVKTNRDGTLTFDRGVFATKLAENPSDVQALMTSDAGPLAALRQEIDTVQVDSVEGALTNRTESLRGSIRDQDERIERFQEYLDGYTQRLRDQFSAMEVALGRLQGAQQSIGSLFAGMPSGNG